jgi:hypothetical protein
MSLTPWAAQDAAVKNVSIEREQFRISQDSSSCAAGEAQTVTRFMR